MSKLRLLNAHAVVRPNDPETVTKNGVMIPEQFQRKSTEATVVAVGQYYFNNGTKMDFDLKPGDVVRYRPHDGEIIFVDDEPLLLLALAQLIGVVEE